MSTEPMSEQDMLNRIDNIDLAAVETSFPLLASGLVSLTINKCQRETEESKKEKDKKNIYYLVEFTLAQPWKTVAHDGAEVKVVNPGDRGSTISKRIYVGTYFDEKANEEKWYGLEELAKLREAVFGKAQAGTRFVPAELVGQQLLGNLKFDPAPQRKDKRTGAVETFGPRTEVASYVKKGR